MTIINQKSISGITSITTAAAGDNLLTVHTNDGTERLRIDSSGNTRITAGIVTTLTTTGNATVGGTLGVTGETTFTTHINFGDNAKAIFGNGSDLQIYHDTSGAGNSIVKEEGTGELRLGSNSAVRITKHDSETCALFTVDGAAELYYDNSKKLETTSSGVTLTGGLQSQRLVVTDDGATSPLVSIRADDSSPWALTIGNDTYSTGDRGISFYQDNSGTGYMRMRGDSAWENFYIQTHNGTTTNTALHVDTNRAVILRYQNNIKLSTKSDGVDITGELQCDSLDVDGASVFMPGSDNSTNVAIFTGGDVNRGLKLGTKGYNGLNDGGVVYNAQTGGNSGSHHFQVNNGVDMVKIDVHGLKFGSDTAAANALDDYEEGTFTATCDNSVTLHSDSNLLQYVKIGSSVTVMGQIRVNNSNSGSSLTINNLPFTIYSSGEGSAYAVGAVRLYNADMASDHKYVIAVADGGGTNLSFQGVRDNSTSQGLGATNDGYYMFSVTYRTTS